MVQLNPLKWFGKKKDATATIGTSSSISQKLAAQAEEAKGLLEAANNQVKLAAEASEKADSLAAKALAREASLKAEATRKAAEEAFKKANIAAEKATRAMEQETLAQQALKNLKGKGKGATVAAEAAESAVPPVINAAPAAAAVEDAAASGLKTAAKVAAGGAGAVVVEEAAVKAAKTGFFRGAAETAVNAATHAPKKLFSRLSSVGGAVGKSRVGAFLVTGAAMIAAGFGIKSWAENREARKEEEAMAMVPEAVALRQNILENQARIAQVSEELGTVANRQPANFRENVRSAGMQQPGQGAGDPVVSPSI
jgi:hypothetical protein